MMEDDRLDEGVLRLGWQWITQDNVLVEGLDDGWRWILVVKKDNII